MKLVKLLLIGFLVVFFGSHADAKSYLGKNIISPGLIDPPLVIGSSAWKDDVEMIIKLQEDPNPDDIKQALDERRLKPETVAEFVDPKLTRKAYPRLYKLLDNVGDTSRLICDNAKNYWHTSRPYLMDERVKTLVPPHTNMAYPSGHTTGSYTYAYVLGLLIPEKRQQFHDRAEEIAQHRILVGMHYPHDIKGGRQLAALITGGLLGSAEFHKDFKLVQKELKK